MGEPLVSWVHGLAIELDGKLVGTIRTVEVTADQWGEYSEPQTVATSASKVDGWRAFSKDTTRAVMSALRLDDASDETMDERVADEKAVRKVFELAGSTVSLWAASRVGTSVVGLDEKKADEWD
jgi:hypothetical protein